MIRALFRKQFLELTAPLYKDGKKGRRRSVGQIVLFAGLLLYAVLAAAMIFGDMAYLLHAPLAEMGLGWVYFSFFGTLSLVLGIFGGLLIAHTTLYGAKDNDLLLAMPIPPALILAVRMLSILASTALFGALAFLPALAVWLIFEGFSLGVLLAGLFAALLLPFPAAALSCLLGWLLALALSRVRRRALVTTVLSLVFLGAYFVLCFNMNRYLLAMLADVDRLRRAFSGALVPLSFVGRGVAGEPLFLLAFLGVSALLFGLVYAVLSRTFLRLATARRGAPRAARAEKIRTGGLQRALLYKECKAFLNTPAYLLNCGFGSVMMLVLAVLALVFRGRVDELLALVPIDAGALSLIAPAAIAMTVSTCPITAPSISLEGRTLWQLRSLPVPAWRIFAAKVALHVLFTLPPAWVLGFALCAVLRVGVGFYIVLPFFSAALTLLFALAGLFFNLKMPNFTWTNAAVPIKQSAPVALVLFGGWLLVLALAGLWFALRAFLSPLLYLALVICLLFALSLPLLHWFRTRGAAVFAELS